MEKNIIDYISLYPECELSTVDGNGINLGFYYPEVWTSQGRVEANGINVLFKSVGAFKDNVYIMNFNQCKLLLRPIADITDLELNEIFPKWDNEIVKRFFNKDGYYVETNISLLDFIDEIKLLLSKHFDLFGLIEAGLAIDKTKLVK